MKNAARLAKQLFGTGPTPAQEEVIGAIADPDRLEELVIRIGHVATWTELLEQPVKPPAAPRARRKRSS